MKVKEGEPVDAQMDLEFLYSNLFDQNVTSADAFNHLVENGMQVIATLLELNLSKDALEDYLQRKVQGTDDIRKVIA